MHASMGADRHNDLLIRRGDGGAAGEPQDDGIVHRPLRSVRLPGHCLKGEPLQRRRPEQVPRAVARPLQAFFTDWGWVL